MNERSRLIKICIRAMEQRGLMDEKHKSRLAAELKEIDAQAEHDYLLDLFDREVKYPYNEHNLFVWYLLDLCDDFDVEKEYAWVQGEFPDIDIDYIRKVRDHLHQEWAPKQFGREKVCAIGTYGALGIKSAILDMTRVYGMSKDVIQSITVKMKDKYDDDGTTRDLDWDAALRLYSDFAEYCEKNPKIAKAAKLALQRNKTGGVHAGGLIIADRRLDEFVPLEVRKVTKETPNGVICSAWGEGLKAQDLAPVGLIKFDMLVIRNLEQLAYGCKLVKERHPEMRESGICAKPGGSDWSDISYLNDPKALAMANEADLTCIFQFDSEGIQKLVKRGGVTSFDDLAAYSALYRPGPLNTGMDARYCKRKKGEEPYNLHPVLEKALGVTYGVMVYQEQVMEILRTVGKIPDMHTEKVRKAISKKKVEQFIKYKQQFIENGQKVLSTTKDFVSNLWDQIESFAEYGFNRSVLTSTIIPTPDGDKKIKDFKKGDLVYSIDKNGHTIQTEVVVLHDHGELDGYEVMYDDGYSLVCTLDHKFLTSEGQTPLWKIIRDGLSVLCDLSVNGEENAQSKKRWMESKMRDCFSESTETGVAQNQLQKMQKFVGERQADKVEACGEMRSKVLDESEIARSQEIMPKVPRFGMEEFCGDIPITMWKRIHRTTSQGQASQGMSRVRNHQTGEYSQENEKVEQGQSTPRQKEDIFRDSEENFGSARDTGSTCRTIEEVEKRKSRKICEVHRGRTKSFNKKIQNGDVVKKRIRLGDAKNSLRRKTEASGFCEGQDLDRSGRVLPFLRASKQWPESISVADSSATRPNAQQGSVTSWEYNVSSSRYDMFCQQYRFNENGMVDFVPEYAPISDTGSLVSREIVRVCYVGKRQMCDLEVASPTHNFLLPNGVVTSNSHAYAYTYVSSRLLYLKSHFPIEFYTAILMCEKETEKYKGYKLDAKNHDVTVRPAHINKSKANFHIEDDEIYFGFENIKGIGPDPAQQIADSQPYDSYRDFLDRFGTNAKEVTRLTALGCFDELEPDHDHVVLRKFHEFYKDILKKRRDRNKRFEERLVKLDEKLMEEILSECEENHSDFEVMCQFTDKAEELWEVHFDGLTREVQYKFKGETKTKKITFISILQKIRKEREKSIKGNIDKGKADDDNPVNIDNFNPYNIELEAEELEMLMTKREIGEEVSYPLAESQFYGFQWIHQLDTSPDYSCLTIDKFLHEASEGELEDGVGVIEVQINAVRRRQSKKIKKDGTRVEFWSIDIEDANARQMVINMWSDDHTRFRDVLKKDAMLRMHVRPPGGGYNTLTFKTYPRHKKREIPPREQDFRCWPLREAEPTAPKEMDLSDFQFDASAIEGLENLDD